MIREKKSRSFNFLIEMLMSVLFFSLACVICVQLFVEGKKQAEKAVLLNQAVLVATNCAEMIKIEEPSKDLLYMNEQGLVDENGIFEVVITLTDKTEHASSYQIDVFHKESRLLITTCESARLKEN